MLVLYLSFSSHSVAAALRIHPRSPCESEKLTPLQLNYRAPPRLAPDSFPQPNFPQQFLTPRISPQRIKRRFHLQRRQNVGVLRIPFFQPRDRLLLIPDAQIRKHENARIKLGMYL
jgi:hypothetical protein